MVGGIIRPDIFKTSCLLIHFVPLVVWQRCEKFEQHRMSSRGSASAPNMRHPATSNRVCRFWWFRKIVESRGFFYGFMHAEFISAQKVAFRQHLGVKNWIKKFGFLPFSAKIWRIIAYSSHIIDNIEIHTCLQYREYHKLSFNTRFYAYHLCWLFIRVEHITVIGL